jgi:hypothetical protein
MYFIWRDFSLEEITKLYLTHQYQWLAGTNVEKKTSCLYTVEQTLLAILQRYILSGNFDHNIPRAFIKY